MREGRLDAEAAFPAAALLRGLFRRGEGEAAEGDEAEGSGAEVEGKRLGERHRHCLTATGEVYARFWRVD